MWVGHLPPWSRPGFSPIPPAPSPLRASTSPSYGPDLEGSFREPSQTFREQLGYRRRETQSVLGAAGLQGAGDCPLRRCPQHRGPGSLWPHSALKWVEGIGFSGPVDQQGALKKAQRAERMWAGGAPVPQSLLGTKPSFQS